MNKSQVLSLSIASAISLLSFGGLRLINEHASTSATAQSPAPETTEPSVQIEESGAGSVVLDEQDLGPRFSFGDKILLEDEEAAEQNVTFREAKRRGVEAVSEGDFPKAVSAFEDAISTYANAPETLIYLNNARIGDAESYTLAISVPIEGDSVDAAKEMLRGIAQKQNEVNLSGGINGKPLRVLVADDDGDEDVAEQVAEALVDKSDVLGVVGHFTSDTSIAASKIYQAEGLVMISPTSTSVELSNQGEYIFRSLPADNFNATALVNYMLTTLNLQKAAIFYNSDSAYSTKLREVFKERLFVQDGRVVDEFDLNSSDFDAAKTIEQAIEDDAEVIILFHNTGVLSKGLEVIEANNSRLPILSGDSGYKPEMLDLSNYTENVITVTVPWISVGSEDKPFSESAQQLWKANVSWRSAMTYDATQALTAALEQADSREDVQAALTEPDFTATGVSEEIKFQRNTGDRDGSPILVTVKESTNNQGQYRFAPVK